ncbi:pyridoxamine 5'-phosphate oxidase [Pseudoxanthomonas sp. SGNA-20]|jgi:pyridoxamine-phosphate oxidase|uniref:pyridoxamine 5'-phosphate oxidase n=1 Tax=unclassified Pseudoxanthomonas TaxID=2645906 RepID=UPI0002F8D846|nr:MULTISPECIES: pyridoxamine 5'-phosphate oxidase [unclassified Pseudoxanthomonas]RRN58701.1 pyridoxamine 5'-phosphate oxidase [Pseudoxanthomonas sp. SGNA-20]
MTDPLYAEALQTFGQLLEEARASGMADPNAMTVATADAQGRPHARTVLLKAHDERGFVFYTHLDSPKGRDLRANPHAALLFLWRHLREAGVQVRIEGEVGQVDAAEADAYFASRPRMSQLGAWASRQSQTLGSRAEFEAALAEAEARFRDGPVPRPPGWSGFRVVPRSFEFWYGAGFRLHERWSYERGGDGAWSKRMLQP